MSIIIGWIRTPQGDYEIKKLQKLRQPEGNINVITVPFHGPQRGYSGGFWILDREGRGIARISGTVPGVAAGEVVNGTFVIGSRFVRTYITSAMREASCLEAR